MFGHRITALYIPLSLQSSFLGRTASGPVASSHRSVYKTYVFGRDDSNSSSRSCLITSESNSDMVSFMRNLTVLVISLNVLGGMAFISYFRIHPHVLPHSTYRIRRIPANPRKLSSVIHNQNQWQQEQVPRVMRIQVFLCLRSFVDLQLLPRNKSTAARKAVILSQKVKLHTSSRRLNYQGGFPG